MLKNIYLHIDDDEMRQHEMEQQAGERISALQQTNFQALRRSMPGILDAVRTPVDSSISILCQKNGALNIIDFRSARVLYSQDASLEAQRQVEHFSQYPLRVTLDDTISDHASRGDFLTGLASDVAQRYRATEPASQDIDVLVVLGLGLGQHIRLLIEQFSIKHLIVYEPQLAYLQCSVSAIDYQSLLDTAQEKGTAIYFQVEKDGADLANNITELAHHFSVNDFYLFQHYPQPTFNHIAENLALQPWSEFKNWLVGRQSRQPADNYVSDWQGANDKTKWRKDLLDEARFEKNLDALKTYFPALYDTFSEYTPQAWEPMADSDGQVNVFNKHTLAALYSDAPQDDCQRSFDNFSLRPNKDGLVLGYTGQKLRSYLHYQLVAKVSDVLDTLEESRTRLPDTIKSMLMFGMGVGYQITDLFASHSVEKLFICEPNRDYFYASLYAIDWAEILKQVDANNGRIYLNIGDDGTSLVHDLLHQFHSIGPYILSSTYFYQGYYNPDLNAAWGQLREQLQVIISMGDYFDHSRFGIAHTHWALEHSLPFLKNDSATKLSVDMKETPVFIVGNGPSLDGLMPMLKEHHTQAIIVSCGTALQSLHRNGITPDFHAEIESNRATFDWACRVGDFDYLKKISLISCNGVHPDTCQLYKDVYLALKEGESSTSAVTELFPEHNFAVLNKSYPTVTNFAVDFITTAGFEQLYLFGVDMGFVDQTHHHSKSSGYYKDGEQLYNYSEENNTQLIIPGNFRAWVNTKYEFKVSKSVLEQAFGATGCEVYNLNDGAKIVGAEALTPENLLIISQPDAVSSALSYFKDYCFSPATSQLSLSVFDSDVLLQEFSALNALFIEKPESRADAETLIDSQRQIIVQSLKRQKSLLFYYLNGSLNFINSAFLKTLNIESDAECLEAFQSVFDLWKVMLEDIRFALTQGQFNFDYIATSPGQRRKEIFRQMERQANFTAKPDNYSHLLTKAPWLPAAAISADKSTTTRSIILCRSRQQWRTLVQKQKDNIVVVISSDELLTDVRAGHQSFPVVYLPGDMEDEKYSVTCNDIARLSFGAYASYCNGIAPVILPKLAIDRASQDISDCYDIAAFDEHFVYLAPDCVVLTKTPLSEAQMVNDLGDRLIEARRITSPMLEGLELTLDKQRERKATLLQLMASAE